MRKFAMLPLLMLILFVAACDDITGVGGRSLEGDWTARVEGEQIWLSIRDDRGDVRGSGEWGYDDIWISGERMDSDVYLIFEFDRYNPIELEGRISGGEIEGRLYGSGYDGERVQFRRESRRY